MRGAVVALLSLAPIAAEPQSGVAMEALKRMKGIDLEKNPAIKTAVLKVLDSARGTPQFVQIIQEFKIPGRNPELLAFALEHPKEPEAVTAIRLILDSNQLDPLRTTLKQASPESAGVLTTLLGKSSDPKTVPLLLPIVSDLKRPLPLRKTAVDALTQTQDGSVQLLDMAKEDRMPADVKLFAGSKLNAVRWTDLQKRAAEILPAPQGQNAEPLHPIATLLGMKGDAAHGKEVFFRPESVCGLCHRIRGEGVDFCPDLSEIGTKLGKDALYEAILDPSAGISFGYEAWQIETKDGEEGFGLMVSETADEVVLKAQSGVLTHFKKSDIAQRKQLTTSIMPAGLQQTMSVQDLVDLVEYLSTLKKP